MRSRPSRTPSTHLTPAPGSTLSRWAGSPIARREHYELRISLDVAAGKISEHLIAVRVYDRHENVGVAKTVIAAEEK